MTGQKMTPGRSPLVDVVIPVHDPTRPLQRAIDSVLNHNPGISDRLAITVVCHNLDAAEVIDSLSPVAAEAIRVLELNDGLRSASGPFSLGVSNSDARFICLLGSDDHLEPGALDAWLELAEARSLAAVIAPERHASGRKIRTPPIRPWRRGPLRAVRDRLTYRTAPLGLVRKEVVDRLGLTFPPALSTGTDQSFSAKLWFSAERVEYARRAPGYVVGADARTRVTFTERSLDDEFAFIRQLLDDPWFQRLGPVERSAIVIKLTRVHLFSAATRRSASGTWSAADRESAAALIMRFRSVAPSFERPFSIADRRLIDLLEDPRSDATAILHRSGLRRRFGSPATLLARDPRGQFAVEGPLRFAVASALM